MMVRNPILTHERFESLVLFVLFRIRIDRLVPRPLRLKCKPMEQVYTMFLAPWKPYVAEIRIPVRQKAHANDRKRVPCS